MAGGTLALALLVCGCVFAAMAGPAVSLHLRTEALQNALRRLGPLGTAIQVSASWNTFTEAFTGRPAPTEDDLSGATSALASGLAASVPFAPGSWAGLTTPLHHVLSGTGRLPVGYHPELEVTYRDQLTSNIQVIAGRVADAAIPPGVLGVAVTPQTAARYALHPGSRDRELTLARLSVMGYEGDTSLVLLMALPAVLAAFAAAAGCALALPALVGPALDLSVFTGPGASVTYRPTWPRSACRAW